MFLPCLLPFLATKGSRVLEEKVNETEVSKTVFSHLKCNLLLTSRTLLSKAHSKSFYEFEKDFYLSFSSKTVSARPDISLVWYALKQLFTYVSVKGWVA